MTKLDDKGLIPPVYDTLTTGAVYNGSKLKTKELVVESSFMAGFNGEEFTEKCLILTSSTGGSGVVVPQKDLHEHGSEVRITATADAGYEFEKWVGLGIADATSPTTTVKMDDNRYIRGQFKRKRG